MKDESGTSVAVITRQPFASALTVVALALHALYLVGDRTWWGEWFSIWPPVGWLVLALPAVTRRKNWIALLLLGALAGAHGEWPRLGSGSWARGQSHRSCWSRRPGARAFWS